jgi:hypothetical protein
MAENQKTPNDFGLAVQENPDSALQITARNKQKNVREFFYSMRLDGTLKETSYLRSDPDDIELNINTIKKLINKLNAPIAVDKSYVWRKIDKHKIISFLEEFRTFANDRLGLSSRMPIAFIKKYAEERDTEWDIALYNGTGSDFSHNGLTIKKEKRQFTFKKELYYEIQNRQVSSGNSESIAIQDPSVRIKVGSNRRDTRQEMKRPLLMLHILEQKNDDMAESNLIREIAAFGVSFPGNVLSKEETVKIKINTVYYQNLLEQLEDESKSDD